MLFTARQLEDLHKGNGSNSHADGQIVLPYGARLTPLAADWVKAKRISLGYSDVAVPTVDGAAKDKDQGKLNPSSAPPAGTGKAAGALLWWCNGACGAGKAAVAAVAKDAGLRTGELASPADGKAIVLAVKELAAKVKAGEAELGVLLVQTGATALMFANRCPSLRAVLGTSMETVEQAVRLAAANVLVIEYARQSLQPMKNLLSRFVRNRPALTEDVKRQLQELASCG